MGRYDPPDPLCHHVATCRVSSHEDLAEAARSKEPMASTHCCDREACQADAKEWVHAMTHRDAVVVPIRRRAAV
jgi:hypothetical protein